MNIFTIAQLTFKLKLIRYSIAFAIHNTHSKSAIDFVAIILPLLALCIHNTVSEEEKKYDEI